MNNHIKKLAIIVCVAIMTTALPALADNSYKSKWKASSEDNRYKRSHEKKRVAKSNTCEGEQNCSKYSRNNNNKHKENKRTIKSKSTSYRNEYQSTTKKQYRQAKRHTTSKYYSYNNHRVKQSVTIKRPKHRVAYNDRIKREYRYIQGPWYSTRYISPFPTHRHKVGQRLSILPRHRTHIIVGGHSYYYDTGVYYRPFGSSYIVVSAPIGAFVRTLPLGFIAFSIGLSTYYHVNDTFYSWDEDRAGYRVVEKPAKAEESIQQATQGRLVIYPNDGQDDEQQAKDRYECHRWASNESGIDPSLEENEFDERDEDIYRRSIAACLEGRQYAVR